MHANTEIMYWHSNKEWYRVNEEKDCYELTDKAPQRAVESFEMYKKQNGYDSKDLNKELETFIINNSPITLGKVFEFFCKRGYTKKQIAKALNNFNKNHMNLQSKEMDL